MSQQPATESTTRAILVPQLELELGVPVHVVSVGGRSEEVGKTKTVTALVPAAQLRAALRDHVPDPLWGRDSDRRRLAGLVTRARDVLSGGPAYTSAEVSATLAVLVIVVARSGDTGAPVGGGA